MELIKEMGSKIAEVIIMVALLLFLMVVFSLVWEICREIAGAVAGKLTELWGHFRDWVRDMIEPFSMIGRASDHGYPRESHGTGRNGNSATAPRRNNTAVQGSGNSARPGNNSPAPPRNSNPAPPVQNNAGRTRTGYPDAVIYFANNPYGSPDKLYRFRYKKVGDSWRAYILRMPSLGSRAPEGTITHRLFDNEGAYICWNSDVRTKQDMQTISRVWADNIQKYIATGERFG